MNQEDGSGNVRLNDRLGSTGREDELEASALHWEKLADAEIEKEAWDIKVGVFSGEGHSPYQSRAETYRRAAKALRIQKETGVAVCACCFKPFGQRTPHK